MDSPRAIQRRTVLLPYERELFKVLGLSEDEYLWFKQELENARYIRPAAYDRIPDVQGGPVVPILINLAIGLAASAISFLLAPKPTEPDQPKFTNQKRKDVNGRNRFAPVYGFDSIADIAQLGEPVPIVWTLRTGETGGVVVEPKLVWSRVYSFGHKQVSKALYVVGEGGVTRPDLPGVWLGNNGLNVLPANEYALFFGNNVTDPPLIEGTKGQQVSGDPTSGYFPLFAQAWTPSNNTQFGGSHPIPNGTNYRVNWRVISRIKDASRESRAQAFQERRKVCGGGDYASQGMRGVGVGYPRRQGLTAYNTFTITGKRLRNDLYQKEFVDDDDRVRVRASVDDINKALDQECEAADDLLQIGEKFICGNVMYRVVGRSQNIWQAGDNGPDQSITLEQIGVIYTGSPNSAPSVVSLSDIKNNEFVSIDGQPKNKGKNWGGANTPLLRYTEARVKNSRPVEGFELNIRSVVYGRLNGICNFNDLPYPDELKRYDGDNVSIASGTMQTYFRRTVGFTIKMRRVGETGAWTETSQVFLVRGSSPQAQYNQLRLYHSLGMFEYRLVPLTGRILRDLGLAGATGIWLRGNGTNQVNFNLAYGVTGWSRGETIPIADCLIEPLLWQDEKDNDSNLRDIPQALSYQGVYGASSVTRAKLKAALAEILGDPNLYGPGKTKYDVIPAKSKQQGAKKDLTAQVLVRATTQYVQVGGRTMLSWENFAAWAWDTNQSLWPDYSYTWATGDALASDMDFTAPDVRSTRSHRWRQTNGLVNYRVRIDSTNPFHISKLDGEDPSNDSEYSYSLRFKITSYIDWDLVRRPERRFVEHGQVNDVSHYGNLIETSCDNGPEHELVSVTEFLAKNRPANANLCLAGIAVTAGRQSQALDQLRMYIKSGVTASNSFPQLVQYLLDRVATASNTRRLDPSLIDRASIGAAHSYCQSHGLLFDGVLSERTNLRTFIAQTAPFFLLSMTVSNGKIGLKPALPQSGSAQLFTVGNIVEGTLKVDTIDISQRRDFQAVMVYRVNLPNQLPEIRSVRLAYDTNAPMEQFDMSAYCTSREHAIKVGRYFLALRKYVRKQVSFQTTPDQVRFGPGDVVSLALDTAEVRSMETGTITLDGAVHSVGTIPDGPTDVVFWSPGMQEVKNVTLQISSGKVTDPQYAGGLFAVRETSVSTERILVETINLTEDGLVEIQGTNYPTPIDSDTFGGGAIQVFD